VLVIGVASRLRHDAQHVLERWSAHLDPLAHLSHVLAKLVDVLAKLNTPVVLAAATRFVEGYGLWHARRWALWLGASAGAVFVPFEVIELIRRPSFLSSAVLVANVAVVAVLVRPLLQGARNTSATRTAGRAVDSMDGI
jgi:uncharacterized membrane protein (DUF2068 family)